MLDLIWLDIRWELYAIGKKSYYLAFETKDFSINSLSRFNDNKLDFKLSSSLGFNFKIALTFLLR